MNEQSHLRLNFINRNQYGPFHFNSHRGGMIHLEAKGSQVVDFGPEGNLKGALDFYKRFGKNLKTLVIKTEEPEQVIEKEVEPNLEPVDLEDNHNETEDQSEFVQEDIENEESTDEEQEDSEDTEESEFTEKELEGLSYPKLMKLAKQKGITSKKKEEIISELLGL